MSRWGWEADVAKAATSRIQKSDVRCQNFKVSPMATILKIMNNAGDLDTPVGSGGGIRYISTESLPTAPALPPFIAHPAAALHFYLLTF